MALELSYRLKYVNKCIATKLDNEVSRAKHISDIEFAYRINLTVVLQWAKI